MLPLQITFRDMEPSEAVEARIRQRVEGLSRFNQRIVGCRVMVATVARHHHKGRLFHVTVDLKVPRHEIVVSHESNDQHSHEDVYVAIRDAFDAARRELEDVTRRARGDTKLHGGGPERGRVRQVFPHMDYGLIATPDDREIYFHRNSLLGALLEDLSPGTEVRFVEEAGDEGPQASTVQLV
jgi:cold shock CspA family protein/ribosome-associated translation inhibitor RaiA